MFDCLSKSKVQEYLTLTDKERILLFKVKKYKRIKVEGHWETIYQFEFPGYEESEIKIKEAFPFGFYFNDFYFRLSSYECRKGEVFIIGKDGSYARFKSYKHFIKCMKN